MGRNVPFIIARKTENLKIKYIPQIVALPKRRVSVMDEYVDRQSESDVSWMRRHPVIKAVAVDDDTSVHVV